MTDQYQQNNINQPRGSQDVVGDTALTLDSDLAVVDSSSNPVTVLLPDAEQIPGNTVYINAPNGGTNSVTISGINGQTIDGLPTLVLSTNEASALLKSDGENWQLFLGGGGGPSNLETQQNGATVVTTTDTLNFTGAGVSVSGAGNTATVNIPGGAAAPQSQLFLDDATTDITVGTLSDGCIVVDASISKVNGESSCFRFMISPSPTGVSTPGMDCMQTDSDSPIQDITVATVVSGTDVILRLIGSGTGVQSGIAYLVSSIPRLLP